MSKVTPILDSIFKTNGGTTRQWRSSNEILLTHTDEVKKYCAYMKNKIRDLNKNTQLLALDFLDYSIDDGKIPLWTQVGSKDFLSSLVNIYKTRNDEEVQNKILYLIQKWANKFKKYINIIPNFNSTYDNLKENEVEFPDNMESTYEKYLQGGNSDNNNTSNKTYNNKEINSENKNYLKKINLDLRTSSYERKYKRLVNKLDDWTQQIQDANVFMDLANEKGFDDELRGICNELETGKGQLVDTIESGKLKDEKLMQISLNVQSDIEATLKRWNDVKNGRKPESFKSSFFSNQNNDNSSNNNFSGNINNNSNNNNNNNQNKGGFDLLGFDEDLDGNNNNNNNMNKNNNNLGNDLFDVFSGNNNNANNNMNSNMNNQGNDFFSNMGNNNNQNLFDNNDNMNKNNQNNFNNNFFGINDNMNNQNQNNNNNQGNDFFINFGNSNNNNVQNNNQNLFGNNDFMNPNNQNNQNQSNTNNDVFSQLFNNNSNINNANINNLQNNLNSVYTETNQFGMDFTNNNMNMNNNTNNSNNNNNNFNNIMNFTGSNNSNNNNFNFNDNNNQNNKKTSNNDFVFNF